MKRRGLRRNWIPPLVLDLIPPSLCVVFLTAQPSPSALLAADARRTHQEVVAVTKELEPTSPVTVTFPLSDLGLSGDDQRRSERLAIEGVKILSGEATGIRVFLNRPDANADTPISDSHYVASVAFYPSGPSEQPGNYLIDLRESLKMLATAGEFLNRDRLAVTLVAIPAKATLKENSLRIQIQDLRLELD